MFFLNKKQLLVGVVKINKSLKNTSSQKERKKRYKQQIQLPTQLA